MAKYSSEERKGVAIGCNYSLKLMKEADLIPENISRLEDAIDYICNNANQQYNFKQLEALMNASFYLGAESGFLRCLDRIRDRTLIVNNQSKNPRILRNDVTSTTQFSFTQYQSGIKLNCRVHVSDYDLDGSTFDLRQIK